MGKRMDEKRKRRFQREDLPLYIMAAPTLLFLVIFCYIPMVGIVIAFQNFNVTKGIFGSDFVGFQNFEFLFSTTDAFVITRNTILYNVVFILVNLVISVGLALMLNEIYSRRAAKLLQTVYMMPYFLSWAVVAILATAFLDRSNGFVNHMPKTPDADIIYAQPSFS